MKRKILSMVVILVLILAMTAQPALAYELFTGNYQTSSSGVSLTTYNLVISSQIISFKSKTGPSLQTSFKPLLVLMVQP